MTALSAYLHHRSVIRIGGQDRRIFLQGLISNDIERCREGDALYAALLTPQGKFLHDLFIVECGDHFLIDCEKARADDLLKRLRAYTLRAKVTLENAAEEFDVQVEVPGSHRNEVLISYSDPRLPELGTRLIARKNVAAAGDFMGYDLHRIGLGVADGSRDMLVEKSTLADGNIDLLNGVSWTKGCYVGQELTARMHYRALVKKRLFPVTIEGAAPASGSTVTIGEDEVGEMRSSCGQRGLALLATEKTRRAVDEGVVLTSGTALLKPYLPGWMIDKF